MYWIIKLTSTRYSEAIDACQSTQPHQWRQQLATNRQGSGSELPLEVGARLSSRESELQQLAREVYKERLEDGVSHEQARKDLPLSTYTEAYWKIDLHNLFHFLSLRMDTHAQQEIREYAIAIGEDIVKILCPFAWEAFCDYRVDSMSFSRTELAVIRHICDGDAAKAIDAAIDAGMLGPHGEKTKGNRERSEFERKLDRLRLPIPWQ